MSKVTLRGYGGHMVPHAGQVSMECDVGDCAGKCDLYFGIGF